MTETNHPARGNRPRLRAAAALICAAVLAACGGGGGGADQFDIGGRVDGLTGSGLVLSNGSIESLSVPAAGRFVFANRLPAGASYAVAVAAQPSGQQCSVANASGQVAGKVDDIVVTCQAVAPPPPPPPNTYSVGGSVSGLNGSGLVLQNNRGNDLAVASNGAFAFSTRLAGGAAYTVSVVTQPNGQQCNVANASGSVASANVTNVAVTCQDTAPPPPPPQSYTVGGSITGLGSAGLVLQNNGGDGITVPSGASAFTFPTAIATGGAYSVRVAAQPQGNECTVANGAGSVAQANVTSVQVSCRPAVPLTLQSSTPAASATGVARSVAPALGFSVPLDLATVAANVMLTRAGRVVAATASASGSTVTVTPQAALMPLARYTVTAATGLRGQNGQALGSAASVSFTTRDGAWQSAQPIEADNGSARAPRIAFDASGNALAVWRQHDGTRDNIWANRYTAGTGWGTAALIAPDNGGPAFDPQIAIDANGNALAVWVQSDGTRDNIWANRYTAGTGWGTAALIETDNGGGALAPRIAIDANGNALAVWEHHDGTRTNIRANRYAAGTGWGTAALIETDNAGNAYGPQVAIDANGNALAVWYQFDGTRDNIWSNRYTAGTGWGTAALIETDNAGNALVPQIAIDANGNALAVWVQSDGTLTNIWANRYTAGTGWGTAALIEADDAGNVYDPQVAIDANGNALAVWVQHDGTRTDIWANRYAAGTGWGTATLIETDNAGRVESPQVAFDADGNALAVWAQSDGMRHNIWSNRYTAGTGWGTAALIETDNGGPAFAPQIAIDANGNALAVWHQVDGTRYNILANRFE